MGCWRVSAVNGLPLQTAARVSPRDRHFLIQMQTALRLHILVPWQKRRVFEEIKSSFDLFTADQGGLVYQPVLGVHRNVAEIDFISMYPAIMVYCNISPETLGGAQAGGEPVPELNLSIDNSREGLVTQALGPLLRKNEWH